MFRPFHAHNHETLRPYIVACDQDDVDNMWTEEGMCAAETFISRSTLSYIFPV
jgi:hypothetical protein